jgi:hypothetical protein
LLSAETFEGKYRPSAAEIIKIIIGSNLIDKMGFGSFLVKKSTILICHYIDKGK